MGLIADFRENMQALKEQSDKASRREGVLMAREDAIDLMCETLAGLGFGEGITVFKSLGERKVPT